MDERVENHLADKRKEKCPERVLMRVRAALPTETKAAPHPHYIPWLASCVALITLLLSTSQFWRPAPPVSQPQGRRIQDNDTTRREAYASIAFFGQTLIAAGQRSSQIVMEETLPSLRDGFENTKRAIKKTYESD